MSESNKKYKKVVRDDEKIINDNENNPKDFANDVYEKIGVLANLLEQVIIKQDAMEDRIKTLEDRFSKMENEIYLDNEYDLEILCPYCNYSFIIDSEESADEIKCPECNNIIEIDWSGESCGDDCGSGCGGCSHGCSHSIDEDDDM